MEMVKANFIKIINWITNRRNLIFLVTCLIIHAVYAGIFFFMDIHFLTVLNIVSCCFYFFYLFIKQDTSEKSMVATYFEILLFSVLSELALGPNYGFFLYIIGMSATVFYLLPSYVNKRFLYQLIGIAVVLTLEGIVTLMGVQIAGIQDMAEAHQPAIFLANVGITASIVLAAAFFYSKEREVLWESLNYNMNHDSLTNLYNRRFLESVMRRVPKYEQGEFVISMLDIDFFKRVNDTYGHEVGDAVLVEVASCLDKIAGKDNLAVRWGGEEFIIYFPNMELEQAYSVVENLRKQIENTVIRTGGGEIQITITGGVAEGHPGSNYEKVIKRADEKLYMGKQQGRNRVIV